MQLPLPQILKSLTLRGPTEYQGSPNDAKKRIKDKPKRQIGANLMISAFMVCCE